MEHGNLFMLQGIIFLGAAVLAVVISYRLGLGSVAGYLLAGIAIGPMGFGLINQIEDVKGFAELGVVFLLFVIGLELEPKRLWSMRLRLLTLGLGQVAGSIALITLAAWAVGIDYKTGIVAGMALALSSTALALQPLTERGGLQTQGGQSAFSILLFQDLAVIPMLALLPLLASAGAAGAVAAGASHGIGFALGVIAATLLGGHFLVRPVFRHIARTRQREIFTAFALLLVLGIAWGFEQAGLSMALGTFLAGVLLAESEYRHEIEAAIDPFKGLLLGLFFISVGMSVDFGLLLTRPLMIAGLIVALFALKGLVLWVIARVAGIPAGERPLFVVLLAQGGEFAFVLLGLGVARGALPAATAEALTLAVALSMLATPFLLLAYDRWLVPHLAPADAPTAHETPEAAKVIVAGLGRMGQVVARLLHGSGVEPTILDDDPDHVEQSRRFGFRVFYGDATRLDLLEAAGAARADLIVLALDDPDATTQLARTVRRHFPNLKVIARAHDMRHMFALRDLGVELIERETFQSALALGEMVLAAASGDARHAKRAVRTFSEHDREVVAKLYEVHRQEPDAHVLVSNELRDQLARTLREDQDVTRTVRSAPSPKSAD
jgi:glutathione-regulated potassium-efflux system ancillary protein KefC